MFEAKRRNADEGSSLKELAKTLKMDKFGQGRKNESSNKELEEVKKSNCIIPQYLKR